MHMGPVQRRIMAYLKKHKGKARLSAILEDLTPAYVGGKNGKRFKQKNITERSIDQLDIAGFIYFRDRNTEKSQVCLTFKGKEFKDDKAPRSR